MICIHSNSADIFKRLPESTHIFRSFKKDYIFPSENCQKLGSLYITKIRLGEIFLRKKV